MKGSLFLVLLAAAAMLLLDDTSKRADVRQAESRADAAEQQEKADFQQVEQITSQLHQVQLELDTVLRPPPAPRVAAPAATPPGPPAWFQRRLNGSPTIVDPHGATP